MRRGESRIVKGYCGKPTYVGNGKLGDRKARVPIEEDASNLGTADVLALVVGRSLSSSNAIVIIYFVFERYI
jgi:hypothetical protein